MSKNQSLYIIGNGFDIHHGIPSRYSNFKDFVKIKDKDLFKTLEEYFDSNELWWDFETTLAYLDIEHIAETASDYLESYASDKWSDASHHDYQFEINRIIELVTKQLKKRFTEWILQLKIPEQNEATHLDLPKDAVYINFNYTATLQRTYIIPPENVFHIHNEAENIDSVLILGHSRNPSTIVSNTIEDEDSDVRVIEGGRILNSYFKSTYKSTEKVISENKSFFLNLNNIDVIYVLGHSLSPVDIPYFNEILENIKQKEVKWVISFYSENQKAERLKILTSIGIKEKLIQFITMNDLLLNQRIQSKLNI